MEGVPGLGWPLETGPGAPLYGGDVRAVGVYGAHPGKAPYRLKGPLVPSPRQLRRTS